MINCTIGDLVKSIPALTRLKEERLRVKVSLHIRRISKMIDDEYAMYIELEKELLDRHGEKDDKGGFLRPPLLNENGIPMVNKDGEPILDEFKIRIDDYDAFQKDMDELFSVVVVFPLNPILLSGLMSVKISTADIETLFYLFKDDVSESAVE